ncbi:hypothetical protein HPB47_008938 [Ixodes persulcatus]|uniref:Uncharacterized protein n=1 Tax=Ixodes persulcatus TaxID=34615 RepID=A0AC60P3C1_IXOPE|nr:hypothetical protein HPB47_008938 [Ixodes persulcatus]
MVWEMRAKIPISGSIVQRKALNFACLLGIDNFKASTGQLNRFEARHDNVGKTISGKLASTDTGSASAWMSIKVSLDLYIVLQMMAAAWTATKRLVIADCFTHVGFKLGDSDADSTEDNEAVCPTGEADAGTVPPGVELEGFIDADMDDIAHEEVSDEDIIQSDEDNVPDQQPLPAMARVLDAFDVLRNYVAAHDDHLAMNLLAECENHVTVLLTREREHRDLTVLQFTITWRIVEAAAHMAQ